MGAAWLVASISVALPVQAAELRFDPPADCSVTRESIEGQVERLIGRPLSGVDAINFELRVRHTGDRWRLTLRTERVQGGSPQANVTDAVHARQISGASCAEVTDAAAVAIALTIEGREPPAEEMQPWDEVAEDAVDAEPAAVPRPVVPSVAAAAKPPDEAPQADAAEPTELRFGLGASFLLDGGALPDPAAGVSIDLLAEWSALRIELFGALFLPQRTQLDDGRGGEFDLAFGGVRACGQSAFGDLRVLGCAAFELGQLSARGLRVRTEHPRDTGWQAVGAEAGVVWTIVPKLGLLLRGGAMRPLSQPQFVLDGSQSVHRAATLTWRALLGIETYL